MLLLAQLIDLYSLVVLGAVILSWIRLNPRYPGATIVYRLTEPVLRPIRAERSTPRGRRAFRLGEAESRPDLPQEEPHLVIGYDDAIGRPPRNRRRPRVGVSDPQR